MFNKTRNLALYNGLISQYIKAKVDQPEVRGKVIKVFVSHNLMPDSNAYTYYLLNNNELHEDAILDAFDKANLRPLPDTFDDYLGNLPDASLFNPKIATLTTKFAFSLSSNSFIFYLLKIEEKESKKIACINKYLPACIRTVRDATITGKVAGQSVEGNVAQVYLLTGQDEPYVMQEIIKIFKRERFRLDVPIECLTDGKKYKLKKFIEVYSDKIDNKVELLSKELL